MTNWLWQSASKEKDWPSFIEEVRKVYIIQAQQSKCFVSLRFFGLIQIVGI
jgi:hypothetical protein